MRFDLEAPILEHRPAAEDHYWMRLHCPPISREARPGQFVHLQVRNAPTLLLRRPLTIYRRDGDTIELLYQVVGKGTAALAEMPPGASLRVLGPLGNPFSLLLDRETALVAGGGVGIASLMMLIEDLRAHAVQVVVLLGAQRASRLVALEDLRSLNVTLHIATDDGSLGHRGLVTDLVERELRRRPPQTVAVYGCGPTPMMRVLSELTAHYGVPTQLALESRMGCALGVCLGCVIAIRGESGDVRRVRVCTEGPIFRAEEIVW